MKKKLLAFFIFFVLIGHFFDDEDEKPTITQVVQPAITEEKVQTPKPAPVKVQPANRQVTTPVAKTMYVDASKLNVRSGPGINNQQVWTLKRDQEITTYQREGDWIFVKGDRFSGWVHGGYLTPNKSQKRTIVAPSQPPLSDRQIVKILIARSIGLYRGNCPCPYNRARNGSRCGKRSAYSRPGGASPLCYAGDISRNMIENYRARQ